MKIEMKVSVAGMFHNIEGGVSRGDVVDLPDEEARRYVNNGMAVEAAVDSEPVEIADIPTKPKRGRPPKATS